MSYEVSPKKGFAEAMFGDKDMIFHSMYSNNFSHATEFIDRLEKELGGVIPQFRIYRKGSSVLWATGGKNKHIKNENIAKDDWGYDNGVHYYDLDDKMLPIKNEEDYELHKDNIVFGRSTEYSIGFLPKDKDQSEAISGFLEKHVHKNKKNADSVVKGSWFVPDFRSTMMTDHFESTIANRKTVGNQELMILSQEKGLKGFESKKIFTSKSLRDILFKAADVFGFNLFKAHVKTYYRTTPKGKTVQVKEHDDKREKGINTEKWKEQPSLNTSHMITMYNASGKNATYTASNVDGTFYLVRGTKFSNSVSAIRNKYSPILEAVISQSKKWSDITSFIESEVKPKTLEQDVSNALTVGQDKIKAYDKRVEERAKGVKLKPEDVKTVFDADVYSAQNPRKEKVVSIKGRNVHGGTVNFATFGIDPNVDENKHQGVQAKLNEAKKYLKDVTINTEIGETTDSRDETLKKLFGEKKANIIMRELEVRSWG